MSINISFELLNSTISLLENIDVEDYDYDFAQLFGYVFNSLKKTISDHRCYFAMHSRDDDALSHPCCSQCDALPF